MGGLCGWTGGSSSVDGADVLREMVDALGVSGAPPLAPARTAFGPGGAMGATSGPPAECSLFTDDRVTIGWAGAIEWASESLRARARDRNDGATLSHAYREQGPTFLDSIQSDVAVAILDAERSEVLLAIDRLGIHSLSYSLIPSGVVFASVGAALAAHPEVDRDVDPQSIFDFIFFHMVPSPRSSFAGWRKLSPGEFVLLRDGSEQRGKYWKPHYQDASGGSESELIQECHEASRNAVSRCLNRSHGRVGAFLSGGIDSSTVAGLLTEISGEPADTYSIGFDVEGFDESQYARAAVEHFGTRHHQYLVTADDVLHAAPAIAAAYSEPFGNASAVGAFYCAKLAKGDGIDTLFAGDGGDEIFAGNERYAKQRLFEYYFLLPTWARRRLLEPLTSLLPPEGLGPIGKFRSYVQQARVPLPDRLNTYNFLNRMGVKEIFAPEFLSTVATDEPTELLRHSYDEAETTSTLHRLLYLDIKFTLADNDLRKVGRTAEMAGIQVQYPFLELGLVEFANRVPPGLKLKGQKLRYFFKKASEGFLPTSILTKSKHGFGVPCGLWMRDHPPLRELAYDSLSSLTGRGYLRPDFVERLRALHQGEHVGYYGVMVWVLTMLELWHQHHIDA